MPLEPVFFDSPQALRAWLALHGASAREVVVGFVKVHTGRAGLTWPQAVDEALCFGWIDGVRQKIDDAHYKIRFTPRKADSHWSAVNIARIAVLQAEGRMTNTGLTAFARRCEAKSRRASYEQKDFPELSAAELATFQKNRTAWTYYEQLPPGYRRKANWIVISAKQPATRERRFQSLVQACADGRRQY
jgi:uncharacterized protein YdeI (YjbR/CyaY-like superfamily)